MHHEDANSKFKLIIIIIIIIKFPGQNRHYNIYNTAVVCIIQLNLLSELGKNGQHRNNYVVVYDKITLYCFPNQDLVIHHLVLVYVSVGI